MRLLERAFIRILSRPSVAKHIAHTLLGQFVVFGTEDNLSVAESVVINNALFNVKSGKISVGEHSFFGHNVSLLTGSHDYSVVGYERSTKVPEIGRDITIGKGVWIASNATVIGPCKIGDNAVVAAGSVVIDDVPAYGMVAGVPAKIVKMINLDKREIDPPESISSRA